MLNNQYKISVIIPTYNRKDTLIRAIESIYKQSYLANEIIVVDDHSSFSVKKLLKDYDKVKVIRNKENIGAAQSRNIGFNKAKGDYVAFLDSDDYWDIYKLEKQISIIHKYPETGIIYCDQFVVDLNNNILKTDNHLIDKNIWNYLLNGWTAPNTSTLLIRNDIFKNLGGFDYDLKSCQEHDLWMNIAFKNEKVKFSSDKLSYYCMGEKNRISFDYHNRINGAKFFLNKWKSEIIKSKT